jgi:putative glutamine amidotransferase
MPSEAQHRPRVGVPWRSSQEEKQGKRERLEPYLRAIGVAGAEHVVISLLTPPAELERLDAVVLPGSPADVDPALYGAARHAHCAEADRERERTDYALLEHAFAQKKPVLAICYGVQSLNVFLGGTLIQDIPSEFGRQIRHDKKGLPSGAEDPRHPARIEPGSKLAAIASAVEAEVNSSHHQAILAAGRNLRVTAHAPDGVIEAVEWVGDTNWAVGVQWHPERMAGDVLAAALFRDLIAAARGVAVRS